MAIVIKTPEDRKALRKVTGHKHATGEKRTPRTWKLKGLKPDKPPYDWETNLYDLLGAEKWPEDIEWELNTNELQELGESGFYPDEEGRIGTFQGIVEKLTGDMDTSLPYARLKGDEPLTQYPENASHLLKLLEPVIGKDGNITGARLDSKFRPKGLTGKMIVELLGRKGPYTDGRGTEEYPYPLGVNLPESSKFLLKSGKTYEEFEDARREYPELVASPPDKEWGSLKHSSSPERHPASSTWEGRIKKRLEEEKKHKDIKESLKRGN